MDIFGCLLPTTSQKSHWMFTNFFKARLSYIWQEKVTVPLSKSGYLIWFSSDEDEPGGPQEPPPDGQNGSVCFYLISIDN